MARTKTTSIRDMTKGKVAPGTREWFRITSDIDVLAAVDAWDKYFDEYTSWKEDNIGRPISAFEDAWRILTNTPPATRPPEFAAVANRRNVTEAEAWFVECRFFEKDEAEDDETNNTLEAINASWCQVNDTNIPTLNVGDLKILMKVFNARRAYLGRDPA